VDFQIMPGAGFILAINLFVAGLFAVAFFLVSANNKADQVARWFAIAYLFGVGYFVFEFVLPLQETPQLATFGGFAAFLAALTAGTIGVARRYGGPFPGTLIGVTFTLSLFSGYFYTVLPRGTLLTMMLYQAPYAVQQIICAYIIWRSRSRGKMDQGLMLIFVLSAAQFLSKPFLANLTDGPGATAQDYIATTYALYSQTAGAVLSVGTGLLMLTILVRDLLEQVTVRSETDPLSGLLNRRGFDERAEPGLTGTSRGGIPASLVVADLDHFKSINDTFGHDAGDRVIRAFAQLLERSAPQRATLARMGGEEFAVFMPGQNLAGARLFAESVRAAFAALPVEGLPEGRRFTASFGVVESTGSESLSDLRRRADAALYAAKRDGRDRVCISGDRVSFDLMPSHPYPAAEPPGRKQMLH
jgi:diguanylate cyclase (GGDEF)-like protein